MITRAVRHRPDRTARSALVTTLVISLAFLAACEVRAEIDVAIDSDGSGQITVAMGFDPGALDRLGHPEHALHTEDLEAVGWEISEPETDEEGFTWISGERSFGTVEELAAVLAEVSGTNGPLRDPMIEEVETDEEISRTFSVTVDLSDGLDTFSDPELEETLRGEPFGGVDEAVEDDEGRPVEEMFDIAVHWSFDGDDRDMALALGDEAQTVEITTVEEKPAVVATVWPIVGAAGLAAAVVLGIFAWLRKRR